MAKSKNGRRSSKPGRNTTTATRVASGNTPREPLKFNPDQYEDDAEERNGYGEPAEPEDEEFEDDEDDAEDGEDAVDGDEDWDDLDDEEFEDEDEDGEAGASRTPSAPTPFASAEAYRSGRIVQLPTGGAFQVRPFSLLTAIQLEESARRAGRTSPGLLPNHLLQAAKRMIYKGQSPTKGSVGQEMAEGAQLVDWLVHKLVAGVNVRLESPDEVKALRREARRKGNPEAAPNPYGPNDLWVGDIFEADKLAVVKYATEGQQKLAEFR